MLLIRAAFEVAYATATPTSDSVYREAVREPGQGLRAWGGWVQSQAELYPHMRRDEHVAVYLNGLRYEALQEQLQKELVRVAAPTLQDAVGRAEGLVARRQEILVATQRNNGESAAGAAQELKELRWLVNGTQPLGGSSLWEEDCLGCSPPRQIEEDRMGEQELRSHRPLDGRKELTVGGDTTRAAHVTRGDGLNVED